jgi:hypothetical protein
MPLILEHARDDKARVTAGLASLSPEKRRDITESQLKQVYQRSLQAEYKNREVTAVADDNGADVTDAEQMTGIPLIGARIITRLRKMNQSLWFEQSTADRSKTGCYVLRNDLKGGLEKMFVCGFETEWNPEFSIRVVAEDGTPKGIISGWRRLLTRLIRAGLISEAKAFTVFGPPSRDSENWARYTQ